MKKALIIGGGFAGCASALELNKLGNWKVDLIEANKFLGAGVKTSWFGGHPYTFGPRHFLTEDLKAFEHLNKYVPLRKLSHKFYTYVERDNDFYNFPINMKDVQKMPDSDIINNEIKNAVGLKHAKNLEEYWLFSVGETIYSKFIENYNKKMWQVESNTELDTFEWSQKNELTTDRNKANEEIPDYVPIKEGPEEVYENCYSGYPIAGNGYDDYFEIATENANVFLNTKVQKYDIPNKTVVINGDKVKYDVIINTISLDDIFDYEYGELKYIGRDLFKIVLPMEHCFPKDVFFLYYANDEAFTRIVEYKNLTLHKSRNTLLGMEIPSNNGRHYPMPIKSEIAKAEKYFSIMPDDVFSIGRTGSYDYNVDIDDCILQAMKVADIIS